MRPGHKCVLNVLELEQWSVLFSVKSQFLIMLYKDVTKNEHAIFLLEELIVHLTIFDSLRHLKQFHDAFNL
jgi:hypothetical protein